MRTHQVKIGDQPLLLSYHTSIQSGSFYDRGVEYAPAVYYETPEEKRAATEVLKKIDETKVYSKPIVTLVLPRSVFWPAEERHQDYSQKHPLAYAAYRSASGRSEFIKKYWGDI